MALSPNYGWAEPDNSSLVKNGAQDIRALGDAIDTSVWNIGYGQAGKNKFINGDFNIWQRGTSATGTAKYFSADRWSTDSTATSTTSRQTFTVGQTDVPGNPTYFMRVAFTTVTASSTVTSQYIEDVGTLAGRTATVSFYAKISSGTASLDAQYVQRFGSGGSSAVAASIGTVNLTTAWQRFIFTVAIPSISGKTVGSGNALQIRLIGTTAAVDYDFANSQIEEGSVATAFQTATKTIQGELAACQRYYQRITATGVYGPMAHGGANATTSAVLLYTAPVVFRTTPATIESANLEAAEWNGTGRAFTALAILSNTSNPQVVALIATGGTGYTTDRAMYLRGANNAAGFLGLGAEL
jgi:hypothetical protein